MKPADGEAACEVYYQNDGSADVRKQETQQEVNRKETFFVSLFFSRLFFF